MLAELAAANAAFAVIKAALHNGKELADMGGKVLEYFDLKAKMQESATAKAGGRPTEGRTDIEEFLALEKLRRQEEELKQAMVYAGRPGLWDDWVKYQAAAARKRREAKEAAERAERKRRQRRAQIAQAVLVGLIALGLWVAVMYGVWMVAR